MSNRPSSRMLLAIVLAVTALLATVRSAAPQRPGALPPGRTVVTVVAGAHTLALRSDGSVVGWGQWIRGQLGRVPPDDTASFRTRRPIPIVLPGPAVDVAAADEASFAVLVDGSVWAWGGNRLGELGTASMAPLPLLPHSTPAMEYRGMEEPVRLPIDGAAHIAANYARVAVLMRDGTVAQWPTRDRDGAVDSRPSPVQGLADIVQVAPGTGHTLALARDGRVWAWGDNSWGAVGVEPKSNLPIAAPVVISGLPTIAAVAAADGVSFALGRDGSVWVWGSNGQGQFGNGRRASHPSVDTVATPERVPGLSNVRAISSGARHVIALLSDGTLRAWGNTDWGQVGNGAGPGFVLTPVAPKITNVRAVFAAGNATFAVKTDDTFWGWGVGNRGAWPFQAHVRLPTLVDLP